MKYNRVYWVVFCLFVCAGRTSKTLDCPKICRCEQDDEGLNIACNLSKTQNFSSLSLSKNTTTLDLSSCGLTRIPSELFANLQNLKSLSLAGNNITKIEENSFRNLIGLQSLNLSNNNLSEWKGPIYAELPSLRIIDLTGNVAWKPDKRLLNVTTLREVRGVTWSQDCVNCLLQWDADSPMKGVTIPQDTGCNQAMLYEFQSFQVMFTETCLKSNCHANCKSSGTVIQEKIKERSYDRGKYFYVGHAVGGIAVFLNLIVLVNILLSKAMRRQLSMNLIANMASCDILIGIYVILISKHNLFLAAFEQNLSDDKVFNMKIKHCQGSTILLTVGEIVSLMTALLLTVEKYTCIVYCMKPDVRLRKRPAFLCLLITWIASFLFAMSPHFQLFDLKYSAAFLCSMPVTSGKNPIFIIYPLAIIAINYILMLPLYLHIFVFVRRSSAAMGLHRNVALAKQVFVMVGSNFLFFAVPMVLLVVNVFVMQGHKEIVLGESNKDHIVYIWLPIMLLGINSLLNPFLYAFRRKKFQRELIDGICLGGRLPERLRRAFSALKSSRMSSSASKVDLYDVEIHSINLQGIERQRLGQTNTQIPVPETERVVLCKITESPTKRAENGSEFVLGSLLLSNTTHTVPRL